VRRATFSSEDGFAVLALMFRSRFSEIPFNVANFRMALSSKNSVQFALLDSWEGLLPFMHLVAQSVIFMNSEQRCLNVSVSSYSDIL
jgi:hypothetical protein